MTQYAALIYSADVDWSEPERAEGMVGYKQFGQDNITCNAIAPGNVKSDAGKMLVPDDSPFIQFLQMTCATRPRGEPDELVGAAIMLCSEAGAWITGQVINSEGGFSRA